jgi:hypothetical protein
MASPNLCDTKTGNLEEKLKREKEAKLLVKKLNEDRRAREK